MIIRSATLADAGRLAALCGQLGYPSSPEQMQRRLARIQQEGDNALLVAEGPNGQAIAWVQVYVRQLSMVDRHAELGGLVVDEVHRGRGVGRLLMAQAEAWAIARGCGSVLIHSNAIRQRAHRFYLGIGYEQFKTSCVFRKELGGGA